MAKQGSGAVGGAQRLPQVAPCPPGRNMAGREPFAAVLSALRRCYAEAVPLETFVRQLGDSGPGDPQVLRADDIPCYRTFVGQCLVCVPHGARAIPRPFTFQQLSSQSEVTTRVVQRLCEKGMKNVLAYGYSLPDENSSELTALPLSKIHNYLPNTATETLRISGFWETLLSRIGDDVMMYLLEHCAIFMLVPPSNCYQVCGQPIYELISCNVDSSLAFVRQRSSKPKRTSLLKYMRNRLMFHRNYLLRSYGWKCRQRREDNVSRMRNERNKRRSLVPSARCSAKAVSKASKQMVTERRKKQSSSNSRVTAAAPSRKRKIHREQPEIPAKRAKIGEKVGENNACSLTPVVNQSGSSSCVRAAAPFRKRKIRRERPKIPAKGARIGEKVREKNACSLTPDVNQSGSSSWVGAAAPFRKRKIRRERPKIPAKGTRIGEKVGEKNACSLTPDVNQSGSSSCVRAAAPSRKRKIHRERPKIPAKGARIGEEVREKNACSLTPVVIHSSSSSWVGAAAPSRKKKIRREQPKIPAKGARIGEEVREKNACNLTPDVIQSSSSSWVGAAAPSRKKKIHRERPKIPAKGSRIGKKMRGENACNLTPDVNQSSSERSETGCAAPRSEGLIKTPNIPQRSDSAVSGPSSGHKSRGRKKFLSRKRSLRQRARSKKPLESSTEVQAESHRKRVEVHTSESQLASVQTRPMEGISSQCRRQESAQPHSTKKLPDKLMGSAVYIERKYLLYSHRSFRECFPKSFILNRLQDCQAGGKRLVQTIFSIQKRVKQTPERSQRKSKWRKDVLPKRYWQMKHVFQKLLENHRKCPYTALLRRNCPVVISEINMRKIKQFCQAPLPGEAEVPKHAEQCGKEPAQRVTSSRCESGHTDVPDNLGAPIAEPVRGESESEEQNPGEACDSALKLLLKQHSSHWQVYMFVRECLEKVIPAELWGSNHNKCRFLKNLKVFISRGKFARMSLQELMWRMRVNDCMWLRLGKGDNPVPAHEHRLREEILAKFLYWLMDTYVVQLLRSFFYITETMFQKNMLFYYRKFVWGKLHDIGIRNHFVKVQLQPLSSEEIESFSKKKFVPVASKLRFIPKPNGLRPIVKVSGVVESKQQALSKKSRENKMNHYNTQLKNLFSVLNYERTVNPSFIGSSVFGKDDIYKTWKQFVTKVLKSGDEIPHFYCVKADVSKAYDTIPHNKLVEVISQVLKPEKRTVYCIRRYAMIMITPSGQARKLFKRHVSTFKDFMPDMKQFVSHLNEKVSLQNAIVVEQSLTFNETSSSLFNFFLQMVYNSVLEIENRYYLQCCGIPQGSILSTLLCSLFYGDMENKLFNGIQQDGVLIRLIDDFLLLTPDLMKAKTFLRALATGIPEYGLLINPNKTVVNFPVDDIPGCSKFKQLPDCRLIPWCGLLLDIKTLEVYGDYSSYSRTSIRSSLSFNSSRTAGKNMKHKLSAVLKLKCHGLFLDLQINSLRTVLINVYKIFLLQAYRFHACVLQLPFNQQVRKNPRFFLKIISQTASCCYAILKTINAEIVDGNKHISSILPIQAVEWLCYHAFTVKLSNHRFIYKCLLSPLKVCEMQLIRNIPEDIVALLKAASEPSVYQDFKTIQD